MLKMPRVKLAADISLKVGMASLFVALLYCCAGLLCAVFSVSRSIPFVGLFIFAIPGIVLALGGIVALVIID